MMESRTTKKSMSPQAVAGLVTAAVFLVGSVLILSSLAGSAIDSSLSSPFAANDPRKAAVREWLQNNLPDPHWKEVSWQVSCRKVSLKYRTSSPVAIHNDLFFVDDGEVTYYLPRYGEAP